MGIKGGTDDCPVQWSHTLIITTFSLALRHAAMPGRDADPTSTSRGALQLEWEKGRGRVNVYTSTVLDSGALEPCGPRGLAQLTCNK